MEAPSADLQARRDLEAMRGKVADLERAVRSEE